MCLSKLNVIVVPYLSAEQHLLCIFNRDVHLDVTALFCNHTLLSLDIVVSPATLLWLCNQICSGYVCFIPCSICCDLCVRWKMFSFNQIRQLIWFRIIKPGAVIKHEGHKHT
jgi:hypothetical protein